MKLTEGYKMVPVEPTTAMWNAAWSAFGDSAYEDMRRKLSLDQIKRLYDMFHYAMLAAAPQPPAQEPQWKPSNFCGTCGCIKCVCASPTKPAEPIAYMHDLPIYAPPAQPAAEPVTEQDWSQRYRPVKGSFWWHYVVGNGTQRKGKFYTEIAAKEACADLLTAFLDGKYVGESPK
jgi:hypothetical protein